MSNNLNEKEMLYKHNLIDFDELHSITGFYTRDIDAWGRIIWTDKKEHEWFAEEKVTFNYRKDIFHINELIRLTDKADGILFILQRPEIYNIENLEDNYLKWKHPIKESIVKTIYFQKTYYYTLTNYDTLGEVLSNPEKYIIKKYNQTIL